MDAQQLANTFVRLDGDVYPLAAGRLALGLQRLSNEAVALLLHLARAPSTLSVKVWTPVAEDLLSRQVDTQ